MGIPGFICYLSIFICVIISAINYLNREKDKNKALLMLGLISAVIAYGINLFSIFEIIASALLFYMYVGVIAVMSSRQKACEVTPDQQLKWGKCGKAGIIGCTVGLLLLSSTGLYNYYWLFQADIYYELGRKLVVKRNKTMKEINQSISFEQKALKLYPTETFYVNELVNAMGGKISKLVDDKKHKEAVLLYNQCLVLADKYKDSSWHPDILLLILGVNAFYLGKLDDALFYFKQTVERDRWCFKAHTAIGVISYFRYLKDGDLLLLANAFEHSYTTTRVMRYAIYWDRMAMDNTFKYGEELYQKTRNPEVLRKMVDMYSAYVQFYFNPEKNNLMLKLTKGTVYNGETRALRYVSEYYNVKKSKTLKKERKKFCIDKYLKSIRNLKVDNPVVNEYIIEMENTLEKLECEGGNKN